MVYILHNQTEKEHPDDFAPSKKRRLQEEASNIPPQQPKPAGSKKTLIRWFLLGSLAALLVLGALGLFAVAQMKDLLQTV